MEHSTILIVLTLFTLLAAIGWASYELWGAKKAKEEGEHSALAARFGGKKIPRL